MELLTLFKTSTFSSPHLLITSIPAERKVLRKDQAETMNQSKLKKNEHHCEEKVLDKKEQSGLPCRARGGSLAGLPGRGTPSVPWPSPQKGGRALSRPYIGPLPASSLCLRF